MLVNGEEKKLHANDLQVMYVGTLPFRSGNLTSLSCRLLE